MKTITTQWLIDNEACIKGIRWFNRNYPKGMKITKKNITELYAKLLKRKKLFEDYWWYGDLTLAVETNRQMHWLLDNMPKTNQSKFLNTDWETTKGKVDLWWKCYKGVKK